MYRQLKKSIASVYIYIYIYIILCISYDLIIHIIHGGILLSFKYHGISLCRVIKCTLILVYKLFPRIRFVFVGYISILNQICPRVNLIKTIRLEYWSDFQSFSRRQNHWHCNCMPCYSIMVHSTSPDVLYKGSGISGNITTSSTFSYVCKGDCSLI